MRKNSQTGKTREDTNPRDAAGKDLRMQDSLKQYRDLIGFLKKALPDDYDMVLFDLTKKGYPVLEQTTWSERELAPLRKLIADSMKKEDSAAGGDILNRLITTGNTMHKVSIRIISDGGHPLYAFCFLLDMSFPLKLNRFAMDLLQINGEDGEPISFFPEEPVDSQRTGELDDIPAMVAEFGTLPEDMTPSERREVCVDLYDVGVFRLKGAIPKTAEALGISEQTVYRYVSAIRKARS